MQVVEVAVHTILALVALEVKVVADKAAL